MCKLKLLILSIAFVLVGCDDPGNATQNNATNNQTPPPPASTSAWVEAAVGGVLALDDGARLELPAGALTTDATVVFSRVTCEGYVRGSDFDGCLYEVALEGAPDAVLHERLVLSLPSAEATPGCLMGHDEEGWRCQGDWAADTGVVRATATSPGAFVLRSPPKVGTVTPNAGTDLPFEACGGDLIGDWQLALAFGTVAALTGTESDLPPGYTDCAPYEHYEGLTFFINENLSVTPGGEGDAVATWSTTGGYTVYAHSATTAACLDLHQETCPSSCEQVAGVCGCLIREAAGNGSGGDSLHEDAEGQLTLGGQVLEYCVLGDTLTVRRVGPLGPTLKMYTRR